MKKITTKVPSRSSTAAHLLCLFSALVTLSYAIYYQSKASQTQSSPVVTSHVADDQSFNESTEETSDEAYVAAALRWEQERIESQRRETESDLVAPHFVEGRSFVRYTQALRSGLEQIPEDQAGLREPLLERLEQAEQDSANAPPVD